MISFKEFLSEAQQGFKYEQNAAAELKKLKFVPDDFTPAGASSSQPDLIIMKGKKEAGCELKISAASAGSLILKYNFETNSWHFNEIDQTDEEKMFLASLASEIKLFDLLKDKWSKVPLKNNPDKEYKGMATKDRYAVDKVNFPDVRGELSATKIEDYYQKKKTHYVNVGSHGFYLMGSSNPLSFNGVPRFGSAARAVYRARVQYKGSGNYQFTFETNFSIPSENKSPFNIAPTVSETDVSIAVNKIKLPE
jgi:hypothetical protein